MSQTATLNTPIEYSYDASGEVRCQNPRGLVFFLRAEPPAAAAAAKPAWQPVPATREVAVRREAEPQPIAEKAQALPQGAAFQPVEAAREVEARRREAAPASAPAAPAAAPEGKGWLGKIFGR